MQWTSATKVICDWMHIHLLQWLLAVYRCIISVLPPLRTGLVPICRSRRDGWAVGMTSILYVLQGTSNLWCTNTLYLTKWSLVSPGVPLIVECKSSPVSSPRSRDFLNIIPIFYCFYEETWPSIRWSSCDIFDTLRNQVTNGSYPLVVVHTHYVPY